MFRGFVAAVVGTLMLAHAPGAVGAEPARHGFNGFFELRGTHGYRVSGLIGSDGKIGQAVVFVSRGAGEVTYLARGKGTASTLDVDFGRLGRVDVEVRPTGAEETIPTGCGGKGKTATVPGSELVGTIDFRGEEGFTEAETTATPLLIEPLLNLVCGGTLVTGGDSVGGALVRAKAAGGPSIRIQQNHPGAPVFFQASEHEKEGNVRVTRTVGGHLGAGAFRYVPSLSHAFFSAASPFSGTATYVERTPAKTFHPGRGTWRGSLKVDFPGDAGVRLAGPGFKASIVHAHRTETTE